jgi:hypothetical protein
MSIPVGVLTKFWNTITQPVISDVITSNCPTRPVKYATCHPSTVLRSSQVSSTDEKAVSVHVIVSSKSDLVDRCLDVILDTSIPDRSPVEER